MMGEYRKSQIGVYPVRLMGWRFQVIAPNGTTVSAGGYETEAAARKAAKHAARFYDRLERDRVDGVVEKRTNRVLEHGVRNCERCGKPHDLVATTRRGKRWGQTWAAPDCGAYYPEPWEAVARRALDQQQVAA